MAWHGLAQLGTAWHRLAQLGTAWGRVPAPSHPKRMCTRCSVAGSSQLPDSWEETARDERERARWEATFGVVKQLSSLVSDFGSLLERRLNSDLPIEIREQLRQLNHGVDTLSSLAPRPTSTSSMQVDHPPELDNDLPADLAVVDEAAQAAVAAVEEVAVAEEAVTVSMLSLTYTKTAVMV
jgi:hypothetical protein